MWYTLYIEVLLFGEAHVPHLCGVRGSERKQSLAIDLDPKGSLVHSDDKLYDIANPKPYTSCVKCFVTP